MTQEQFDNHAWRKSDKPNVVFEGVVREVFAIDLVDDHVQIFWKGKLVWVSYKNIELVNK